MDEKPSSTGTGSTWAGTLARLAVLVAVIFFANWGAAKLVDGLGIQIWPSHIEAMDRAVLVSVILYIVLMATPFLPGIELGLALMAMLGPKGVVIVYICTLVALTVSFAVGRFFPAHSVVRLLYWLRLPRAAALLQRFNATAPAKRLEFLGENAGQSMPVLLKHRYLLVALLLNVPGNVVIGGGGGLAMLAGMSRVFSFSVFLPVVSVAILPGPVLFLLSKYVL